MEDYRVQLEEFAGPLDLLLYLVRKEELSAETLSIARITEQYLDFLGRLERIDIDRASEYLALASQLLEYKAHSLVGEDSEGRRGEPAAAADARAKLVRELMEYRKLKEQAMLLEARGKEWSRRYGRESERSYEEAVSFKNADLWDLLTAFVRLEQETGMASAERVLEADDTPLAIYVQRVRERLRLGVTSFRDLVAPDIGRAALVATFLALLELARLGEVRVRQDTRFGEIRLEFCEPAAGGA